MSSKKPFKIGDIAEITHLGSYYGQQCRVSDFGGEGASRHVHAKMLNGLDKDKYFYILEEYLTHSKTHYLNEFEKHL